jgi:hypothetical protein
MNDRPIRKIDDRGRVLRAKITVPRLDVKY